jgi:hypothetical protein
MPQASLQDLRLPSQNKTMSGGFFSGFPWGGGGGNSGQQSVWGGNHRRGQRRINHGQDAVMWLHDGVVVDMARWLETSASGDVINVDALAAAFAYNRNDICDVLAGVDARCGGGQ